MIQDVHVALANKDSFGALRALDTYAARYPSGRFAIEAQVLRIDALAVRGDRATAQQLARRFLEGHPDSPYAERLRRLIAKP